MPEPEQSPYFYDKPEFMPSVHSWGQSQSGRVPDPRSLGRDSSDLMKIMDAMLGPGGYMKYLSALKAQREKAGTTPDPTPTMSPTAIPGGALPGGFDALSGKTREERLKEQQRQFGI